MPFGMYKNFAQCVRKNKSKRNPSAYCAVIKRKIETPKKSLVITGKPVYVERMFKHLRKEHPSTRKRMKLR